jgi:hypothetical protein
MSETIHLKKNLLVLSILFLFALCSSAQPLAIEWQQCLGGEDVEDCNSIAQTFDGGYIFTGSTNSIGGEVSGNHGKFDYWVAKVSSSGILEWQKCFGGTEDDYSRRIIQCSDSGYMITGFSNSNDGDVSGNHGRTDYWVVKTDVNGSLQWQRSLGGTLDEWASTCIEPEPGTYIIGGYAASSNGDVAHQHGYYDEWIVALNDTGGIMWQSSLGGTGGESASKVIKTSDGGFMVLGTTASSNGDVSFNHGMNDIWLVKLDAFTGLQWEKTYGGSDGDMGESIIETSSGGYCVAGYTFSNDGDVSDNHGNYDGWVINVDSAGNLLWQKTLGGSGDDFMYSLIEDTNGMFIISGGTSSVDSGITNNHGTSDMWLTVLDNTGSLQWQKCFGGFGPDNGNSIMHAEEGGYLMGGGTGATDGDVTGNHGSWDAWLVKLNHYDGIDENILDGIAVYPNPATDKLFIENTGHSVKAVEVRDPLGKNLVSLEQIRESEITVDISQLSRGIYFVILYGENDARSVKKVVKL